MASKQLIGVPAPFGTLTTTLGYTGVLTSVNKVQSHSLRDDFDKADLKNGDGAIIGRAATNRQHTVTVETIFYDASVEANARSATKLADMFALVILGGTGLGGNPGFLDGNWNYDGGSYDGRMGDYHKYTLNLWRGGAGASPAALPLAT
jgi:hypothetical protein